MRYPFLDRRLIELVLRLPETHVRWDGEHRGLHRGPSEPGCHRPSWPGRTRPTSPGRTCASCCASVDRDRAVLALAALGPGCDAGALLATYDAGLAAFARRSGRPGGFDLWAALSAGAALMAG